MEEADGSNPSEPTLLSGVSTPTVDNGQFSVQFAEVVAMSEPAARVDLDELELPVCDVCGDCIEEPDQSPPAYEGGVRRDGSLR